MTEPFAAGSRSAQPVVSSAAPAAAPSPAPATPASRPPLAPRPQVLVTDLDGTLVRERTVSPRDVEALARWREAGNLLVLATGRSVMLANLAIADASAAAGEAFGYDYVICATGTTLLDARSQVLRSDPMSASDVAGVLDVLEGLPEIAVVVTTLEGDFLVCDTIEVDSFFRSFSRMFTPATRQEALTKTVTSMPVRVPDEDRADLLAARVVERLGGRVEAPRSVQYFDVVPAGQGKGSAIGHLREVLAGRGIEVGRVVAAGDSWNDIPMFEVADLACAMASGKEDARRAALAAGGVVRESLADLVDELLAQ